MRAIWTGSLGFGLVNIPVKLYSAVEDSTLDLDMLDKKDHSHIKFLRVNEKTGKEVKWENIVKGYDLDGKYVILTDEDFQKASPEKTKHIEILQFVEQAEVDSMYYESPYYLAPEKTGAKAYALLRDALEKSGKAGVGTYVLRNKENIGLIKVSGDALVLNKMRFGEEIRSTEELKLPEANPKATELKMAMALIDQLTEKFDMSKYHDTYSDELMKLIKAKAKGKVITPGPLKVVHSKSKDLMSQLKASLEGGKKKAS
ncbi:non-homologous end joining protein Ku [Pinibacter aurantiacus]|uniref:Non-homologous end joining protein Ku n=1 Tax=Pinibacter aurantiacus TaxID=2851599 RepID=A0A9E2SDJ4_9BACT|nr:Ku protein [Pinibacter aurantiacus]MBV4359422.1 Ku protein [Pinibacter aurantiacus]